MNVKSRNSETGSMMAHPIIRNLILLTGLALLLPSCYNDNEEYLYPDTAACDTSNVSYIADVAPVLTQNCNACHGGAAPQAGIRTDNYDDLMIVVGNGKFGGAINHQTGFSPMPQNGPKLNSCDLAKINQWIANGAPNN